MLVRYPHKATLRIPAVTNVGNKGIIGISNANTRDISLTGRFEHKSGLDVYYKAKFYMEFSQTTLEQFQNDDATFHFQGRQWDVVRIIPYQTHMVIWLN